MLAAKSAETNTWARSATSRDDAEHTCARGVAKTRCRAKYTLGRCEVARHCPALREYQTKETFRSLVIAGPAVAFAVLAAGWGDLVARGGDPAEAAEPVAQLPAQVAPGPVLPPMDPVRGKALFASKGCVVCPSINGVGGHDAPALDAATMAPEMDPFDFAAKMWRGAVPMTMMQQHELGHQITFTGQDLADIIAFVHNRAVQQTFSAADIPPEIKQLTEGAEGSGSTPMGGGG
ncbi:MAG TPA: hypothetical protein VMI72_11865, partial [Roseiarcus sp.]|nr:hypothetical protein [Roseiarcus sp.]